MYKDKKILALIPARGGSKGLPRKNIKPLLGKPLIAWTIESAKQSKYIDYIYVSTEDEEIASISKEYGAQIPFMRPKELAEDTSTSIDVILYSVLELEKFKKRFDILILLEPTSPLRNTEDIDNALDLLFSNQNNKSLVGLCKVESCHPDFLVKLTNEKKLVPYKQNGFIVKRRQEIDDLYFFEGSIYISCVATLKKMKSFYHCNTIGYIVPKWKSYEIDDYTDFIIVEAILSKIKNGEKL